MATKKEKELLARQQAQAAVAREALAEKHADRAKHFQHVSFSMRKNQLDALLEEAKACDMSRNDLLRLIVSDYIERHGLMEKKTGSKEITWKKT